MANQMKKQKKELLDWLVPVICIVIVVGVLVGLLINPVKNGIDYARSRSITLVESEDGSVVVKRPVAQAITWLQLYESFRQSYSNYSLYKYYTNMFGDSINLSSLISDEEVAWVESNISAMQTQLGLTFYTYANVNDDTITNDDVAVSTALFALYLASGTETYLGTYLGNYLENIEQYVAVAGAANAAGVTLDEDDLKSVDETMDSFKGMLETVSYKKSLATFIKNFMGDSIKESDVREAYELMTLVSKYSTQVSDQYYDGITDAERVACRDDNKDDFYTATYLKYAAETNDLAKKLEAATSQKEFKEIVAESILDTQYVLELAKIEQDVLTRGIAYEDDMIATLNGAGFSASETYTPASEDLDAALAEKLFDGEEKDVLQLYLVESEKGVYLVWFHSASSESAEVRTKFYAYDGYASYDSISTFRADVYKSVLASLETEDVQYAAKHDSTAYLDMIDNCLEAVKNKIPTEITASYKTDAEENSFEAWISDLSLEAGATASFDNIQEDTTTYDAYFLLTPMALDEEASVNGGYLKFDTESAAEDGKKSLEGKTGTVLVNALKALDSDNAVVSTRLVEDDFDEISDDVKGWFFTDDRKNGDTAIIAVTKEVEEEDTTSEEDAEPTVKTVTEYYLVAFHSSMSIWESKATEGAADDKTTEWIDKLVESLKVNEKELTRLGVDLTKDEGEEN